MTPQNEAGESLKNVLLVLNSAQLLVPPPASGDDSRSPLQKEIWDKSHLRIGKILPGFLEDFVAGPEPTAAPTSAQTGAAERKSVDAAQVQPEAGKEGVAT